MSSNPRSLADRLREEIEHPDTSGAPYSNDPDLLAECLAAIEGCIVDPPAPPTSNQRTILQELVNTAAEVYRISERATLPWHALAAALKDARTVLATPDETPEVDIRGDLRELREIANISPPQVCAAIRSLVERIEGVVATLNAAETSPTLVWQCCDVWYGPAREACPICKTPRGAVKTGAAQRPSTDHLVDLANLLREARQDWITDTEWVGDQYGGVMQPTGEALRAFGARIDAALSDLDKEDPVSYDIEEAIRIAGLWRAGKLLGADQDGVREALLTEVERLRVEKITDGRPRNSDGALVCQNAPRPPVAPVAGCHCYACDETRSALKAKSKCACTWYDTKGVHAVDCPEFRK